MSMSKPPRVWVSNDKPKAGEVVRVRAQMEHVMETGRRMDPATQQLRPRHIVTHFDAKMGDQPIFAWELGTSIAQNPYIEFTFKARRSADLHLHWKDDQGGALSASKAITVS